MKDVEDIVKGLIEIADTTKQIQSLHDPTVMRFYEMLELGEPERARVMISSMQTLRRDMRIALESLRRALEEVIMTVDKTDAELGEVERELFDGLRG